MAERSVTVEKSLKALSDGKTLILFEMIAHQELHHYSVMTKLGLTRRQYYSRMFSMLAAGLIRKKNGMYSVTSFGKVVYKAKTLIGKGVSNQWKLSAIDSIEMNSTALLQEEIDKLMKLLMKSGRSSFSIQIKSILMKRLWQRQLQQQQQQLVQDRNRVTTSRVKSSICLQKPL